MKWTKLCGAVVAMLGLVGSVNAGTCAPVAGNGADKACGCAPAYQPCVSKPVICRPDYKKVCSYQRACSKPACGSNGGPACGSGAGNGCGADACHTGCGPRKGRGSMLKRGCNAQACAPRCAPAAAGCAPAAADPGCAAPAQCASAGNCAPKFGLLDRLFGKHCCDANANTGCAPAAKCAPAADPGCAAPARCAIGNGCGTKIGHGNGRCGAAANDPGCGAPARAACAPAPAKACDAGASSATRCCTADPAEVAHWIYESQTACYARQRRRALAKLGKYDCVCNPEIMCAFVYGLNDCDERVRKEAAVQIRKQTKCNPSCCSQKVVDGLTCALSDCDRGVRRAAERALESCGYEVRDCNKASCAPAAGRCGAAANNCAPAASAAMAPATSAPAYAPAASESVPAAPAPEGDVIPVPAPAPAGAEPEAYFPSRLKSQNKAKKSGLANLFGLR